MKLLLAGLVLVIAPTVSFAAGCQHPQQVQSCEAGYQWNTELGRCVSLTTT